MKQLDLEHKRAEKEKKEYELKMKQLDQEHKRKERELEERFRNEDEARKKQEEVYQKEKLQTKEDFTSIVLTGKVSVPEDLSKQVKTSNEKHFCRAHEGMEKNKFGEIIDNLADIMQLNEANRKDLQLSIFMDSKVNAMENYAEGHYAYLRYQVLKTPKGKLDLTYAIHTTNFELLTSSTTTKGEIVSLNDQISENKDNQLVKTHLRNTALTFFEDDCPQQLYSDVGIQERKEAKRKASEKEEEERAKTRKREEERAEAEAKAEQEDRQKKRDLELTQLKEKHEREKKAAEEERLEAKQRREKEFEWKQAKILAFAMQLDNEKKIRDSKWFWQ